MSAGAITDGTRHCVYCPTLCLHACPVVAVEHSDAVSPWGKMSMARWLALEKVPSAPEHNAVLYKCTSCGACQAACVHDVDVANVLRLARAMAVEAESAPFSRGLFQPPVEADDDLVLPVGVSGARLYAAGFTQHFLTVARANVIRWNQRSELLLASAEDYRVVTEVYPEHNIRLRPPVRLAAEANAAAPARSGDITGPVAYHEGCHLVRSDSIDAEAVRALAQKRAEGDVIELFWRGETLSCCGASGAYAESSPQGAKAAARRLLLDARDRGAKTVLTGCSGCAEHMADVAAELGLNLESLA